MKPKKILKRILLALLFLIAAFVTYSLPPRVGHSQNSYAKPLKKSNLLSISFQEELRKFAQDTATKSEVVIALKNNEIIFEKGDTKKLINLHSARKSIMSLLIGIAKEKGMLQLDESLGSLGIDESKTPLTEQEKTATIKDLLMARSGVYLQAEAEVDYARDNRPKREQYRPGEFFFYNNFDFNVLGAILEQKTGKSIGEFMEEHLTKPMGMQDFSASNVVYDSPWPIPNKSLSDYPVYWIYMSARDLAKIGTLVAQNGNYENKQIISAEWMDESLKPYTKLADFNLDKAPLDAYGYLWWLDTDENLIWADGYGGQYLLIDPATKLVFVQRNFTGNSLMSSGLFLLDKHRDASHKNDLKHLYEITKKYLEK
ncbi:serine hydrolase domain-containing protein [Flagellimonas abyssi]|uniref:Beta-lactamase family protein n=1 Tax=Flagellimonas abyssi TaxID=2864871 RepID=A0ABS7EWQ7_9FLAO|nr:serine hydrolase [Allomuricauda abyssi]MBW8201187.1 beta-lactamase family protein [Allomuricauda abyssi]